MKFIEALGDFPGPKELPSYQTCFVQQKGNLVMDPTQFIPLRPLSIRELEVVRA